MRVSPFLMILRKTCLQSGGKNKMEIIKRALKEMKGRKDLLPFKQSAATLKRRKPGSSRKD